MGSGAELFLKAYLAGIVAATVLGLIAGYGYGPDLVMGFLKEKGFIIGALRASPLLGVVAIFANNLFSSLVSLTPILGLLVLGFNMAVIGSLASLNPYALLLIIPHGVFELPAIYYSVYLGGRMVADAPSRGAKRAIAGAFRDWARIVVPLLVVAAFVEVFISMPLASSLG